MIYLDYQATTPVAPEVADSMRPWAEDRFANPHSPSRWGREAQAAIEVARRQVEKTVGLKGGSPDGLFDHHQRADGLHTATAQRNSLANSVFSLYSCKMSGEYVAQPLCAASFATR